MSTDRIQYQQRGAHTQAAAIQYSQMAITPPDTSFRALTALAKAALLRNRARFGSAQEFVPNMTQRQNLARKKFCTWPRSSVAAVAPGRGSTCVSSAASVVSQHTRPQAWIGNPADSVEIPPTKRILEAGLFAVQMQTYCLLSKGRFYDSDERERGAVPNAEQSCLPRGARVHCLRAQEDPQRPGLSITWASQRVQLMGYIKQM